MAYEVTNTRRGSSIIRCEGASTNNIALSELSTNTSIETISNAQIKRVAWSTGGSIEISRDSDTVATLYGSGEMRLDDFGHSIANNATSDITVTIATGGTCFIEVSKTAVYTTDLDQL